MTDAATLIATLMHDRAAGRIRWLSGSYRWAWWDGHRWNLDGGERKAVQVAGQIARTLPAGTAAGPDVIRRAVAAAAGLLQVPDATFDADRASLNTPGGIVDLGAGTVGPCTPAGMHTLTTAAYPDPGPGCREWLALLDATVDDPDGFARIVGAALSGTGKVPVLYGPSARLLSDVVVRVLGGYAARLEMGVGLPAGARVAYADLGAGSPVEVDADWVNRAAGGPRTLWVACRHLPRLAGRGAFTAAARSVPVRARKGGGKVPPRPAELAAREGDGILAWMVAGAAAAHRDGLPGALPVTPGDDLVLSFITDRVEVGGRARVAQADLRDELAAWSWQAGVETPGGQTLTRTLRTTFGVVTKCDDGVRSYVGVSVRRLGRDAAGAGAVAA